MESKAAVVMLAAREKARAAAAACGPTLEDDEDDADAVVEVDDGDEDEDDEGDENDEADDDDDADVDGVQSRPVGADKTTPPNCSNGRLRPTAAAQPPPTGPPQTAAPE